jgi:hypothetical protein
MRAKSKSVTFSSHLEKRPGDSEEDLANKDGEERTMVEEQAEAAALCVYLIWASGFGHSLIYLYHWCRRVWA